MGVFAFNGGVTTLRGGPSANQYNSFAQFLLGQTSSVVSELLPFDNNRITSRQKSYSFYGQDQWQASRKLTAVAGHSVGLLPDGRARQPRHGALRLQYEPDARSAASGAFRRIAATTSSRRTFRRASGIAYRPTETTVVRAGYGLNYDPYPLAFVRDMLTNYPE